VAFLFFLFRPAREKGTAMTRWTLYLPALIVAAVLVVACAVATLLAVSKEAETTFPGKNGKIAFTSTRDGKTGSEDIYTMNPNGTSVERLTNDPKDDFEPAWSPDGNRIAFVSDRDGKKPCRWFSCYEIYTMSADGQALDRLTNNTAGDFNPDWQPLSPRSLLALIHRSA
jgi:dipeptidyl aminopeptidase/acylaminoacyl peptidase